MQDAKPSMLGERTYRYDAGKCLTASMEGADPLCRLLALCDRPRDIAILAPQVRREITWLLLHGPGGVGARSAATWRGSAGPSPASARVLRIS